MTGRFSHQKERGTKARAASQDDAAIQTHRPPMSLGAVDASLLLGHGGGTDRWLAQTGQRTGGNTAVTQHLQLKSNQSVHDKRQTHDIAQKGIKDTGGALPHLNTIQKSFGAYDISGIQAHVGNQAKEANEHMGSVGYSTGGHVAFRGSPDVHLAAHEAAHAVQQAGGVQLKGGVGSAGDRWEQHADAVASQVARGGSAEPLLAQVAKPGKITAVPGGIQHQLFSGTGPTAELRRALNARDTHQILRLLAGSIGPDFQTLCAVFTQSETQWFLGSIVQNYADIPNQEAVLQQFRSERTVSAALGMENQLYWAGPSGPDPADGNRIRTRVERPTDDMAGRETNTNDFARWVRGEGPEPTTASRMNCWEAVLFSAFRGGVVSRQWLVELHNNAAAAGAGYHGVLEVALGYRNAQPMTSTHSPARGDIVFMNGLAHVALALGTVDSAGRHEVLSLWILPRDGARLNSTFQRTTVEQINDEWGAVAHRPAMAITFAPNPFR